MIIIYISGMLISIIVCSVMAKYSLTLFGEVLNEAHHMVRGIIIAGTSLFWPLFAIMFIFLLLSFIIGKLT